MARVVWHALTPAPREYRPQLVNLPKEIGKLKKLRSLVANDNKVRGPQSLQPLACRHVMRDRSPPCVHAAHAAAPRS